MTSMAHCSTNITPSSTLYPERNQTIVHKNLFSFYCHILDDNERIVYASYIYW